MPLVRGKNDCEGDHDIDNNDDDKYDDNDFLYSLRRNRSQESE